MQITPPTVVLEEEWTHHHHQHHLSLNREGRWGTTDDFTTSFLHFSLSSTALWNLANSRLVHFRMSSHLFLCLPCLSPLSLCLARWFWPDLIILTWPYHYSLRLFTVVRSSLVWLPAGSWHGLPRWQQGLCMRCVVSCGSTSFPWLVFFFWGLLWGSMIHKHTGRWIWQGSASIVSWNWEKDSCHSRLVSTLSLLLPYVLSWRVHQAFKLVTVSSYCPFTLIYVLMPLVLFVISLVFSALTSML